MLDMGMPVKIVTLAENLIRMYGKVPYKDVPIKFTGLRPGEKIKEELLMNEEATGGGEPQGLRCRRQGSWRTPRSCAPLWPSRPW